MDAIYLKIKYETNEKLATDLQSKSLYDACVNRFYYACIQKIAYILYKDFESEAEFESARSLKTKTAKAPNSNFYKDEILLKIKLLPQTNPIKIAYSDFNDNFNKLKILRTDCDYKNIQMLSNDATKALKYKTELFNILNNLNF